MERRLELLSKEISYALRHAPWEYELELDSEGWVPINQLIESLSHSDMWKNVSVHDLEEIIKTSEKKRHEIKGDKIRALYGHSIPNKIVKEMRCPPNILYHGTARKFIESIKKEGLLPQARQYVHLSVDIDTATQVAKRRDSNPVILVIHADKAYQDGLKFYFGNDKVWLADFIKPEYIDFKLY